MLSQKKINELVLINKIIGRMKTQNWREVILLNYLEIQIHLKIIDIHGLEVVFQLIINGIQMDKY